MARPKLPPELVRQVTVSFRCRKEVKQALDRICEDSGKTKTDILCALISEEARTGRIVKKLKRSHGAGLKEKQGTFFDEL